jgi:hypothetical protein
MKLALVTDAWQPQVNGVVTTVVELVREMEALGHQVVVIHPGLFDYPALPGVCRYRAGGTSGKVAGLAAGCPGARRHPPGDRRSFGLGRAAVLFAPQPGLYHCVSHAFSRNAQGRTACPAVAGVCRVSPLSQSIGGCAGAYTQGFADAAIARV